MNNLKTLDLSKNKFSQYGEEIIVSEIFKQVKTTNKFFVDIGAGGAGRNLSNTKLLSLNKWTGLSFDMDGSEGTIKEFIKPSNILSLLKKYNCPNEFDFLSVDIDSFDYDIILNILSKFTPRLVCAEYNATLDPNIPVKLQYEDGYTWDGTNKYGFSFSAGKKLFEKFGYTIVHNHADTNIFALRNDLVPNDFNTEIVARKNVYHPINTNAIFINV